MLLANLMPLAGVLFLGWEPGALLFVYWLESAVVGFFNVIKMAQAEGSVIPAAVPGGREINQEELEGLLAASREARAQSAVAGGILKVIQTAAEASLAEQRGRAAAGPVVGQAAERSISSLAKIPMILFFLVHYGMFMAGHAVFLLAFFGMPRLPVEQWFLTTSLLFASHGISYLIYFLGRGEYRVISANEQMGRPYGRIALMHVTIIFGGMLIQAFRAQVLMLALLVGLKVLFDLSAHFRSHARYEGAFAPA